MTVKELIKKLQAFAPQCYVMLENCGNIADIEFIEFDDEYDIVTIHME